MRYSEEYNLRDGLVYDPTDTSDTDFFRGDTATPVFDTVNGAMRLGDSTIPATLNSRLQFLFGDFEFTMVTDSLSPDSNDGASAAQGKRWGLINVGDTLERGAAYFEMDYDTVTGGDTGTTAPLRAVIRSEAGTVQRKNITWDTLWADVNTRYRIRWESDGYKFLINDSVYATLGDKPDSSTSTFQINTTIPQHIRIVNTTLDDCGATLLKFVVVRNARIINKTKLM